MIIGDKIIEATIKRFDQEGEPCSKARADQSRGGWPTEIAREMDEGVSLRVAILHYVAR